MAIKSTKDSFQLVRHNLDRAEAAANRGNYTDAMEFAQGALRELGDLTVNLEAKGKEHSNG